MSPAEFFQSWPSGTRGGDVVLLDVREREELDLSSVPGATHIPMMEVPSRLQELPDDKPVVVMCHIGGRSRRVAEFLAARGFEHVFNLRGGIDAWAREIDQSVPRY